MKSTSDDRSRVVSVVSTQMGIPQWDIGIYCVQCTRKSLKRAGRVGNHPGRELSSGAMRAAARVAERRGRRGGGLKRGIQ